MIDKRVDWILRIGLAFAFLYPPIDAIFDPYSWLGYFPSWMHGYVPDMVLLHGFGVVEVLVALWILSGCRIFLPSCVALLMLLAIVIFDGGGQFEILFRDLSIASIALALAVSHYPWRAVRYG
jgi:uncharacterized membrane protein YphA (DoxX/SURF4 family)